jgi:hypothetical protein
MIKNKKIITSLTGLVFTSFLVLFLHSELNLFCDHNDICTDVDLCLIIDNATIASDNNIDLLQHSVNIDFCVQELPIDYFYHIFYSTLYICTFLDKISNCMVFLQYIILLI